MVADVIGFAGRRLWISSPTSRDLRDVVWSLASGPRSNPFSTVQSGSWSDSWLRQKESTPRRTLSRPTSRPTSSTMRRWPTTLRSSVGVSMMSETRPGPFRSTGRYISDPEVRSGSRPGREDAGRTDRISWCPSLSRRRTSSSSGSRRGPRSAAPSRTPAENLWAMDPHRKDPALRAAASDDPPAMARWARTSPQTTAVGLEDTDHDGARTTT